jgi:hypothetical protein
MADDPAAGKTLQDALDLVANDAKWKNGEIDLPVAAAAAASSRRRLTATVVKADLAKPAGCQDLFYKFDGADGASDLSFMTTPLAVN